MIILKLDMFFFQNDLFGVAVVENNVCKISGSLQVGENVSYLHLRMLRIQITNIMAVDLEHMYPNEAERAN